MKYWRILLTGEILLNMAVMDAAVDTLGYSTGKHQDWFDNNDAEIQNLRSERNTAFAVK